MKNFWFKTWRHLLGILIVIALAYFAYAVEYNFFPRLWVSAKTMHLKIVFFFQYFFSEGTRPPYLLGQMYSFPNSLQAIKEIDFGRFWNDFVLYNKLLISRGEFFSWLLGLSDNLMGFARWVMILGILFVMLIAQYFGYFEESQAQWSRESLPLRGWYAFRDKPLSRFVARVGEYAQWFYHSAYFWVGCTILVFALRLPSFVMDLFGEYFYFFASFSIVSFLDVLIALVTSLIADFSFLSPPVWALLIYIGFRLYCVYKAQKFVEGKLIPHDEEMVNSDTGVFTLILGKMRGGKTTLATAFARIVNTVYHKNAFDNMNRVSLMFPEFPYIAFERDIIRLAAKRRIVNMQQAAAFAYRLYEKSQGKALILYNYDVSKRRSLFYDGSTLIGLADALAIYAESYWIYFHNCNLIASNYPIRTDDIRMDKGHLILWDSNYYRRKNKKMAFFSQLSHILVWDMLRFGKKVDDENLYKDAAGPMVCVATEFGKEYGNMVTNQTYSANDEAANPKNDLLDYSMKLGGHLANIWHTNFFKFIADEQRSGSLSSNLVDVAQTIFTADPKNQKEKCALHLWWLEPAILDWIINFRDKFYKKYRYNRDDPTLMFHVINSIASFAYWRLTSVYNRYGYREVLLPSCTADSSGNLIEGEKEKFYIINYVDFAYRFESACMKDFLNAKKSDASRGFFDLPIYKTLMPSKEEWDMQGSYLVSDLENPSRRVAKKADRGRNGSRRPSGANRSGRVGDGGK